MTARIQKISAITFAVQAMSHSVEFYRTLGFELIYGGKEAPFSTLQAGDAIVNLVAVPAYTNHWWGRTIFRVTNVDLYHRELTQKGLTPNPPRDAPWGERYFHITDPDGHELSFAEVLTT